MTATGRQLPYSRKVPAVRYALQTRPSDQEFQFSKSNGSLRGNSVEKHGKKLIDFQAHNLSKSFCSD